MKEVFAKIFKKVRNEFFTIPNLLSFVRLALIPVIVYVYVWMRNNILAVLLVAISALTDIVDGFVARHFNMVTDFGKFLDPLADKLTQLSVMACLITRFHYMAIPFVVLAIKELSAFVMRFFLFKKTERVDGARWHGKLCTVLIVCTMALHMLWDGIYPAVSVACVVVCTVFMVFSATLYTSDCIREYRQSEQDI